MEPTILEKLEDGRIFSVMLNDDKTQLQFEEECDRYFTYDLSKKEVVELIKELTVLAGQMKVAPPHTEN